MRTDSGWEAYFPDSGEAAEDARPIWLYSGQKIVDAEDAAYRACETDYREHEGWERGEETRFPIIVISPEGEETKWTGYYTMSVTHHIDPTEGEDP